MVRHNDSCCDGWEHKMPSGKWMCGKTHGICNNIDNGTAVYKSHNNFECITSDDCVYGKNCNHGECI